MSKYEIYCSDDEVFNKNHDDSKKKMMIVKKIIEDFYF